MGFLISGRLEAVIGNQSDRRTLQVIIPGTFMGELGFLSGKIHSRTIIAKQPSMVWRSSHFIMRLHTIGCFINKRNINRN